jgi:hypothetical protein
MSANDPERTLRCARRLTSYVGRRISDIASDCFNDLSAASAADLG